MPQLIIVGIVFYVFADVASFCIHPDDPDWMFYVDIPDVMSRVAIGIGAAFWLGAHL